MKKIKIILLSLVALALVLLSARNVIVKREARRILADTTGFGIQLQSVDVALLSSALAVRGATLTNPPDFPEPLALEVREARVDYALPSLWRSETLLHEVVLDVPKVVVVRKADGETNLERLSGGGGARKPEPAPDGGAPGGEPGGGAAEKPSKPFRIERLVVRLGTVELHDYTKGTEQPAITTMELNIDQEHRDVTSLQQLGSLVAAGVMQEAGTRLLGDLVRDLEKQGGGRKLDSELRKVADSLGRAFDEMTGRKKK